MEPITNFIQIKHDIVVLFSFASNGIPRSVYTTYATCTSCCLSALYAIYWRSLSQMQHWEYISKLDTLSFVLPTLLNFVKLGLLTNVCTPAMKLINYNLSAYKLSRCMARQEHNIHLNHTIISVMQFAANAFFVCCACLMNIRLE